MVKVKVIEINPADTIYRNSSRFIKAIFGEERPVIFWGGLWCDLVKKYGGGVTMIHLPEIDIKGNTYFPFSDLNNVKITDLMSSWLKEKGLDN